MSSLPVRRQLLFPVDDNYFSRANDNYFQERAIARRSLLSWFHKEEFGAVGKWKTCSWFSTFPPPSSSELWECGNLACLWRDSQGARGKRGKTVFGFPRFP
jgi:hypothetical protein